MVRKRLDDRIRRLLERSVQTRQRSILVLVGDHGKDQVPNLHHILSKTYGTKRPSVLWCYKKELGFSTHRKKRLKQLQRDKARGLAKQQASSSASTVSNATSSAELFDLFLSQTDITWCYYKDSGRILGRTFGCLVLQDFEALTPNLLARTMETVEGGGLVVFLLRTVTSLQQLYTISMDVHARYRTESAQDVVPRFNERFLLSLGSSCNNCLICDDELNVLPLNSRKVLQQLSRSSSSSGRGVEGDNEVVSKERAELDELQESLAETPHVGVLVNLTQTLDQAKAVLVFLEACADKNSATSTASTTVAMTAARGRGKSAAMGLCLAGAVSLGYSQLCVTAPVVDNLMAVFDFCLRGLRALNYQEHLDFTVTYQSNHQASSSSSNNKGRRSSGGSSSSSTTKMITAIHIHRSHRQVIQYIPPEQTDKFATAEILAIDEAAAIPLPVVRALLHPPRNQQQLTFLSSTVNGYEGTGRALSLKLIKELRESKGGRQAERQVADTAAGAVVGPKFGKGEAKVHEQRWAAAAAAVSEATGSGDRLFGSLREIELSTPIRYAQGDPGEKWLNKLLCLDCGSATNLKLNGGAPAPADCELYHVNRDALFSYHKLSEAFLQKMMGLYTSAHYKNTPNDLIMLSDAPAHSVFVLLSPAAEQDANSLPDVLAVVQVALEGRISRKAVEAQLARGHRSAGDLIPWTLSQQFGDSKFAQLSGARIVRIAVHPSLQGMGYGSRAMEELYRFYNGEIVSLANDDDDDEGDDDEESEQESEEESDESDGENEDAKRKGGIHAERLKPRKELPPLLLPLTEVDAPQLDWIGTSFGLTLELHKFWSRTGMRMLYLRQTKNDLTGEHSAIMLRALPRRTGVNDAWLPAFVGDTRRRFISLLGGPFRDMGIRLTISVLENMNFVSTSSQSKASRDSVAKRSGSSPSKITAGELDYFLTPHDMKRLELYGRNLCDHHLITDLIPVVGRLYFTGRFGADFSLSSVQSALLCGVGLQNRTIDSLTSELGLPASQVLAMFNKAVRKLSIAMNAIMEDKERKNLMDGEKMEQAEKRVQEMRDVTARTLEQDVAEAADTAMKALRESEQASQLPAEISEDPELRQYVIKGSDQQWDKALKGKDVGGAATVQIQTVREKRKTIDEEDVEHEAAHERTMQSSSSKKAKKKKKKSRRS